MVRKRVGRKQFESNGSNSQEDLETIDNFGKYTRDRLKIMLRERGLSIAGRKADMVQSLMLPHNSMFSLGFYFYHQHEQQYLFFLYIINKQK